jgi:hypothetical protein
MKQHFCPAEQSMIAFEKECNWCGEKEPQIAFNAEVVGYVAPQRTWVGLTDEEIQVVAKQARSKDHAVTLTNKLLREKNT